MICVGVCGEMEENLEKSLTKIMEHVHEDTQNSTLWLDAGPFQEFLRHAENRDDFERILLKHLNKRFSSNLKCDRCYVQDTGSFFSSFSSKYFTIKISGLVWKLHGSGETYGVVINVQDTSSCCFWW